MIGIEKKRLEILIELYGENHEIVIAQKRLIEMITKDDIKDTEILCNRLKRMLAKCDDKVEISSFELEFLVNKCIKFCQERNV